MKARHGFVSNSSSSSYLVCFRGKLTREKLLKALGVPASSPLRSVADGIAAILIRSENEDERSLMEWWGAEALEDLPGDVQKALKDFADGSIMRCRVSNDGETSFERFLYETEIRVNTPDLRIEFMG